MKDLIIPRHWLAGAIFEMRRRRRRSAWCQLGHAHIADGSNWLARLPKERNQAVGFFGSGARYMGSDNPITVRKTALSG